MTTATNELTTRTQVSARGSALRRGTAVLLVIEFLLIFGPTLILGAAVGWPASLGEPASVMLPLVLEQYPAVLIGYSIYLVYSILFWPVAYLTGKVIVNGDTENTLFRVASGFAALSALARSLGIARWLFAMPLLARTYTDPSSSPALQETVGVIYETLNAYLGGVGEMLGVSLFAVIWLVLISILILRNADWPNWLAYFGFVAAASLVLTLGEVVGIDMGLMLTLSVTLIQFWMLAAAVVFWRSAR